MGVEVTMDVLRFDVLLVQLDPTQGSEIRKTRPCVVISPNEMNRHLRTLTIAPMTTAERRYPSRVDCEFRGKRGQIVLDQIRTVDRSRITKVLGKIDPKTQRLVLNTLAEMFAP